MKLKCLFWHDWVILSSSLGFTCSRLFRQCAKCGKVGEKFINAPILFRDMPDDSIYGRKEHKSEGDSNER